MPNANETPSIHRALLMRIINTGITAVASLILTYFGAKIIAAAVDPTKDEKKEEVLRGKQIISRLKIPPSVKLSEHELCMAANLLDADSLCTTWEDIGGLASTIQELKETVILPLKRPDFFVGSKIFQAPQGILLYGPPGCGKTMLARATAKAAGVNFINLQVSTLFDKWYGESQRRVEAVFSFAYKVQPAIIFIDEIDSLLRSRDSADHETTAILKTQFMSFWDGLVKQSDVRIIIMGATNRPTDVDAAILRRMPSKIYVGLPNKDQREKIIEIILKKELVAEEVWNDIANLAEKTNGFSGSDLHELCRKAAMARLRSLLQNPDFAEDMDVKDRTLTMKDFEAALKTML